ncbi:cation:proton antiporter [Hymenobacter sp. GOD-10R]|uniref:cation:proton antiporter domain-containing protein n=1 Tax=Hymenobacter sp. GOD-10R TaxID=3093922 RepID=UPI002D767D62|nr:cation:proton antiporter [Hymenobacter sp. GOD-10R]WRQ30191.1 cation:proton antiporter [Hymenobacter sp. GOD-10R]
MELYTVFASLLMAAALVGYVNHRFLRLPSTIRTWSGLRGGISVALALSLPPGHTRDRVVGITYVVVVFSIIIQGLSIGPLVKRLGLSTAPEDPAPASH